MIHPALVAKIKNHTARIGVIGLGYVGLPLALEFAKKGYPTTGIDVDTRRVETLRRKHSYIPDVPREEVKTLVEEGLFQATSRYDVLARLDAIMICVPTPLRKTREPDISYIVACADQLAKYLHRHQVIVLESTTYPGTTEEVILPKLAATHLKVGKDFFLGFSPERIDPGNPEYGTTNIPKVVSGVTANCKKAITLLYGQVIRHVIPVSSTKVAEMVKLLENTFRSVNIGLVNELALMCNRMGVDVWEVIEAAKTKPFGFMPFYPGPGLGGHCIPIDPLYLSWKAKSLGFESRFIDLSAQVNGAMPEEVVFRAIGMLNGRGKSLRGSRVLVLGVAYKKNVSDIRESPALEILMKLKKAGARIAYHDPFVPKLSLASLSLRSTPLSASTLARSDCVIIVTEHENVDYSLVVKKASLILDTRNALRNFVSKSSKVIRL